MSGDKCVKPNNGGGSEAMITFLKLRNVACVGPGPPPPKGEGTDPSDVKLEGEVSPRPLRSLQTIKVDGKGKSGMPTDSVFGTKYKYCKTELREVDISEVVYQAATCYTEEYSIGGEKLQKHVTKASLKFMNTGKTHVLQQMGTNKWWTAVWENPKGSSAFPCAVEVSLTIEGFDDTTAKKPIYDMLPFEAKLRDPEKPPACCAIS